MWIRDSDGGVWPSGDITHSYPSPGTYQARVDTTFTGDFRINGGPCLLYTSRCV